MEWVEVLAALIACHLVGDYALQTDWQAVHKHGGLTRPGDPRRALVTHVTTYTLAFLPAFLWMAPELGAGVLAVAAGVFVPHLLQDDGRFLMAWGRRVKGLDVREVPVVSVALDQTFHVVTLFALALAVGAA